MSKTPKIVVAGAGSVGCYLGGALALAGRDVTLLLRPRLADELGQAGLTVSDYTGRNRNLPPQRIALATDPASMASADFILVTVKSAATAEIAAQINQHARADACIVSFQNGIGNADVLRAACGGRTVVPGMVGFNVVHLGGGKFHQATESALYVSTQIPPLVPLLDVEGLECRAQADMRAVLWGKLLLNLNNALNALSGLPLYDQLMDRRWRCLLADMMNEALTALAREGITPARMTPIPPRLLPYMLRLPTPIYRRVAAATLKIDRSARSSMAQDLELGRLTEVDYLQGAVIELAAKHGISAPLCARIVAGIRQTEAAKAGLPNWSPDAFANV
jgi:2-dehydropantoate 2-reductase